MHSAVAIIGFRILIRLVFRQLALQHGDVLIQSADVTTPFCQWQEKPLFAVTLV